jgi:hypothetical protein
MINDEMFSDPEPLDENDPEVKEEMFETYKFMRVAPEDLKTASEEERREYAEWLAASGD